MRPKINTSYRSHGKWGDFLACVLPTIWCLNILTNSSFILRLIEWQNESSLFTIRIRGRQWYWVYKFELRHIVDIMSAPKNIGNNQWVVSTGGSIQSTDNYFYALRLRNQNSQLTSYWDNYTKNFLKSSLSHSMSSLDSKPVTKLEQELLDYSATDSIAQKLNFIKFKLTPISSKFFGTDFSRLAEPLPEFKLNQISQWSLRSPKLQDKPNFFKASSKQSPDYVNYSIGRAESLETSRFGKRNFLSARPILITKSISSLAKNPSLDKSFCALANAYFNKERSLVGKIIHDQAFLVLKQKRYKRKKVIPERTQYYKNDIAQRLSKLKIADRPYFTSSNFLESAQFQPTKLYRSMKKNKIRHENMPVSLSRRLLRTKKTLVIPAHVNLTLVTNSYDVVHSWFIPALGIKLDCVPGRSTHHVFYCDNVGFYYGQCAEICGRYHHHMPIRLCALPFEHFVVWWQHFGLNKLLFSLNKKRYDSRFAGRTFSW